MRDKAELIRIVDESYRSGCTVSHSELEDYTSAIAAPIFNHKREVAAGISIAGFEARFQKDRLAVHLIVRQGNEAMYIEKIEGTQTVRLYTAIGRRSPLYAGACARSILTFLPEEERDAYIEQTELVPILTGMPKTSVYRMVCSLEEMGFLDRDENGMYSLGLLFLQYGHLVSERLDIRKIALPIMEELRDDVDDSAFTSNGRRKSANFLPD
ncbi:hypothetical protein DT075_34875 [Bacillus licheniformis]|nr:hypothetical protein DT075_34875 [Bacillus licheniformis]